MDAKGRLDLLQTANRVSSRGRGKAIVTDPINSLDTASLSDLPQIEVAKLRAAYDRAGPKAVAEGMSHLSESHPDLFKWLIRNLRD